MDGWMDGLMSVRPPVCSSVRMSVRPSVRMSVRPTVRRLFFSFLRLCPFRISDCNNLSHSLPPLLLLLPSFTTAALRASKLRQFFQPPLSLSLSLSRSLFPSLSLLGFFFFCEENNFCEQIGNRSSTKYYSFRKLLRSPLSSVSSSSSSS